MNLTPTLSIRDPPGRRQKMASTGCNLQLHPFIITNLQLALTHKNSNQKQNQITNLYLYKGIEDPVKLSGQHLVQTMLLLPEGETKCKQN